MSGLYSASFNRRRITETGVSFSYIPHFVSHFQSAIGSVEMSACLNHCWPRVWSHQVGPRLAIVVFLFKKLKKKA